MLLDTYEILWFPWFELGRERWTSKYSTPSRDVHFTGIFWPIPIRPMWFCLKIMYTVYILVYHPNGNFQIGMMTAKPSTLVQIGPSLFSDKSRIYFIRRIYSISWIEPNSSKFEFSVNDFMSWMSKSNPFDIWLSLKYLGVLLTEHSWKFLYPAKKTLVHGLQFSDYIVTVC